MDPVAEKVPLHLAFAFAPELPRWFATRFRKIRKKKLNGMVCGLRCARARCKYWGGRNTPPVFR